MSAIVVPSIFLEMELVRISGRPFSLFNVFLSALFVMAGIIWINADRQLEKFGVSAVHTASE
jgi:hypothetical protein